MKAIIRARQGVVTRINPHNSNKHFLIPGGTRQGVTPKNCITSTVTGTNSEGTGDGPITFCYEDEPPPVTGIQWPAQGAIGYTPAVRNRNADGGIVAGGRGFGMDTRHAYRNFDVATQTGTPPEIYHVTNRNTSGAGSYHDAISVPDRIIVFDVGGNIPVTNNTYIDNPGIWVAGQSAASQVVIDQQVPGKSLRVRAGDLFMQDLIYWDSALPEFPGQEAGNNDNALITDGSELGAFSNVVLANMMFGGGTDQNMLFNDSIANITLIDCLVACPRGKDPEESLGANFHQYGMNIGGNSANETVDPACMIGCTILDGTERNPSSVPLRLTLCNHFAYNYGTKGVDLRGKDAENVAALVNVVGLWARRGPDWGGVLAISMGRANGNQSFGPGSEVYIDDTRATEYSGDEWSVVNDLDNQEGAVRINNIQAASWPTGLIASPNRSETQTDYAQLMTQWTGPRGSDRLAYIQDLLDGAVAGTGSLQTNYATPVGANTNVPYVEPSNPHGQGVDPNRSRIEEDLLGLSEGFRN